MWRRCSPDVCRRDVRHEKELILLDALAVEQDRDGRESATTVTVACGRRWPLTPEPPKLMPPARPGAIVPLDPNLRAAQMCAKASKRLHRRPKVG